MMDAKDARREAQSWVKVGATIALLGLFIILWPEPGLMPKPLPYPPSDAIAAGRPIASWAVLGYPLLAVGALGALLGGVRLAVGRLRR